MHRRSMTGQLERGIGLLGVDPLGPPACQQDARRPGVRHHHSMRATQSTGGTSFLDNVAAAAGAVGQGDVGGFGDVRRRDYRFYGRGVPPPEPLRVDVDPPGQPLCAAPSLQRTCELSPQLKPVVSVASVTLSAAESCACSAVERSQLAAGGGDCARPLSESPEDASEPSVIGVKCSVHKAAPRPAVIPSIPVAIRTGTKEGKEAKDSKRTGSKK